MVRIGREVDQIATERSLKASPLSLPIARTDEPSPRQVLRMLKSLLERDPVTSDGSTILSEADKSVLQNAIAEKVPATLFELYDGFLPLLTAENLVPDDPTFLEVVQKHHPEWLNDPDLLRSAYYIRSTDTGTDAKAEAWRMTRVLLDLFADFAASQVGLFVKDPKLQGVLQKVLENFGGKNIGDSDFSPSSVLRIAFTSTVNGVIDSREALDLDSKWLDAFLEAFGEVREEMTQDDPEGFDKFALGLFQGKGYPRLVGTLMDAAAGQIGVDTPGTDRKGAVKNIASDYLKQVAGLLKKSETDGNSTLKDFLKNRWGDLLRGAFSSINTNAAALLGDDASPLATKVIENVLGTLSEQSNAKYLRFFSGDLLASVADAAVTAIAKNKDLLEDQISEPWFRELIVQTSELVSERGIRSTLSVEGLSSLAQEVVSKTADVFVKNPDLLGDLIGQKWLRQLAPAMVKSLTNRDLANWSEGDLKSLVTDIADTAVQTFANDPGIIEDGIEEKWFGSIVSGALSLAAKDGVASLLSRDGASKLVQNTLRSGAQAIVDNPDLLKINEPWLEQLVKSAGQAVVDAQANNFLTKDGIADLTTTFIDGALSAAAKNPKLVTGQIGNERVGLLLKGILQSAAGTSVTDHFTRDGIRGLLGSTISVLSQNPEILAGHDLSPGVSSLLKETLEAIGENVSSKGHARDLAETVLKSALATVTRNPEILGTKYSSAVALAAKSVATMVDGGKLDPSLASSLLSRIPALLLENPAFFVGEKHAEVASTILTTILTARTQAESNSPLEIASVILDSTLDSVVSGVFNAVAATASKKLAPLGITDVNALLMGELLPVLSASFERLLEKIGDGIPAQEIGGVINLVTREWASDSLADPVNNLAAFESGFNRILAARAA